MEENMKKLEDLMDQDDGFLEALFGKETAEEVQAFLNGKGVSLTLEEIDQQRDFLVKAMEADAAGEELSEEEMDKVAGGKLYRGRSRRPADYDPTAPKPFPW
ncbi:hypothetical protein [Anoxynatronum buryatiense]|uniref:Uncharacterized protein n=1 Tax=Anoxynatronum buryatiense TaxID=489973 RepID=A0AA45WUM8_9CLOT|nr:hypothetical protein [Anoxynatronum buryatiense]SMP48843.1 hypothetical protein SAMN06296020_103287 [Anoxynatronum buryatiense]